MTKIETNETLNAVEVSVLPSGETRIALRKNIAAEERTDDEGNTYTVNTADETVLLTNGEYSQEDALGQFDDLLVLAETGKTPAQYYADRIDEIVREKYSQSAVEAILNNYIANPDDEEIKAEFDVLQEYRASAKEAAKAELAEITA